MKMNRFTSLNIKRPQYAPCFNLQTMYVAYNQLRLVGVLPCGTRAEFAIRDFYPKFLVRCKGKNRDKEEIMMHDIDQSLSRTIGYTSKDDPEPRTMREYVANMAPCKRTRAVGAAIITDKSRMQDPRKKFERKRYDFIEVFASGIEEYRKLVKHLKYSKFKLFNAHNPTQQFIARTGFQYQSWIRFKTPIALDSNCNATISMNHMEADDNKTDLPLILKCFFSNVAVSRDGCVNLEKSEYQPQPQLPFDRNLAICLTFKWSNSNTPCYQHVIDFTTNERKQIDELEDVIAAMDPDAIFHFPDLFCGYDFLVRRCYHLNRRLHLERGKRPMQIDLTKKEFPLQTRVIFDLHACIVKMAALNPESYDLQYLSTMKQLRNPPEKLDLTEVGFLDINKLLRSKLNRDKIMDFVKRFNFRMVELEGCVKSFIEYANISRTCDCEMFDAVSGGQQKRVFNKLIHTYEDAGMYMNDEERTKGALRLNVKDYPPTFHDPPEAPVTQQFRESCEAKFRMNCKRMNFVLGKKERGETIDIAEFVQEIDRHSETFKKQQARKHKQPDHEIYTDATIELEEDNSDCEDEAAIKEGGNVMKACPGHHEMEECILDFASLYPSIMIAFNISFENVVTNRKYLNRKGVPYIYIQINASDTCAIIDDEGILGKMLQRFLNARKYVNGLKAKALAGSFEYANLDSRQIALKVVCNATYGFCGAKNGLFAMRDVLYMVTSLGRFMQMTVAYFFGAAADEKIITNVIQPTNQDLEYIANNPQLQQQETKTQEEHVEQPIIVYNTTPGYMLKCLYGDTDSVFEGIDVSHVSESSFPFWVKAFGKKYKMGDDFSWESVVAFWKPLVKRPDVDYNALTIDVKRRCVVYRIFHKLAGEATKLFRQAVKLEFENGFKGWFAIWKKTYFGIKWSPDCPLEPLRDKDNNLVLKMTGMAAKKRDWCLFTRKALFGIMNLISVGRVKETPGMVINYMQRFIKGDIPLHELQISKGFKGFMAYKNPNNIQCQIALKLRRERRCDVETGERIYFIVVSKPELTNQNICFRVETPEMVRKSNMTPDWEFYLLKQFKQPMKKLFTVFEPMFDFDKEVDTVVRGITNKKFGIQLLSTTQSRPLTRHDVYKPFTNKKPAPTKPHAAFVLS